MRTDQETRSPRPNVRLIPSVTRRDADYCQGKTKQQESDDSAWMLAVVLSVVFNVVLLLTWWYDFGRNVLQPTAASAQWAGALAHLATPQPDDRNKNVKPPKALSSL